MSEEEYRRSHEEHDDEVEAHHGHRRSSANDEAKDEAQGEESEDFEAHSRRSQHQRRIQ